MDPTTTHTARPAAGTGEPVELHAWRRLIADGGWTWQRTERWLVEAATLTLRAP